MTDNELVKAMRAFANCENYFKENNDCIGCPMPNKTSPSHQKWCVGFAEGLLPVAATRIEQLAADNTRLRAEYDRLRNEHCNLCGRYKMAHDGACDGCRWRKGE